MGFKFGLLIMATCFFGAFGEAPGSHEVGSGRSAGSSKPRPLAEKQIVAGKKIIVPKNLKTLKELEAFIKEKTPKGSEPLLLLTGEDWCPGCRALAPRLEGRMPAGKVIFELDVSDKAAENVLLNALVRTKGKKTFMRLETGELKGTRPVFPSLWRFDGPLTAPDKAMVEEGAGKDKVTHYLDNPPPTIDNGSWF